MKKLIVLSVAAALTMSTQTVLAADPSASTSPKAQATTSDLAEFDKQMAQMQQNMKAMQEQMDKIRQTQDPQARQQLRPQDQSPSLGAAVTQGSSYHHLT